jgi:cell division protein FtsI/penicillin-binding protein 2
MGRARLIYTARAAGLIGLIILPGCGSSGGGAAPVARAFLARWAHGEYERAARYAQAERAKIAAELRRAADDLQLEQASYRLQRVDQSGDGATARFQATLDPGGLGTWRYDGKLRLRKVGSRWRVVWEQAVIHPRLRAGERLVTIRHLSPRAAILDRAGRPLVVPTSVVTIGVVPKLLRRLRLTLRVLRATTGIDPAHVRRLIAAARPDQFVPVITLRRSDYERVRGRIHPLPGVHFQTGTEPLAPTRGYARQVLGVVGPATAEALKLAGPPYTASDQMGLSGLQQVFQRRLAGTPSGAVVLLSPKGRRLARLFSVAGSPGRPVRTTLHLRVQAAAESALEHVSRPAALVAVQASTGALLAVANRPVDSFDRALTGLYPPGSSFKVVTTAALLSHGFDPAATVACPPSIVVGGRRFTNFEAEALGEVPFTVDFAKSCNTAFISLAHRIDAHRLAVTARLLGVGARYRLPLAAVSGHLPRPAGPAEHAADLIGQGRVLVSPLALSLVAAAVDAGRWRSPTLITEPSPPRPATSSLTSGVAPELRRLMRAVVTEGTGTAANLPGAPVYGKTGTAEFGTGARPRTHAWFIGFRRDLAFAVLVEGGGVGGRVAAPIAAAFLRAAG